MEVTVGIDTDTYRLFVEKSFKLIVAKILFLDHADILEGNACLIVKTVVTVGLALVWVVIVMHYTILGCVHVRLVHPAAIATTVVGVTIKELLHGEVGHVTKLSRDLGKGFKGTGRCESPARSAS